MYFLLFALGYLIGMIPTAYLLVRAQAGVDLRHAGSTNLGAMNSFKVTGSKGVGVQVALLDALKGVAAVLLGWWLAGVWQGEALPFGPLTAYAPAFWPKAVALLGCLAGHNYNLLLSLASKKLVGGKGFASAGGGFALLLPGLLPMWLILLYLGVAWFVQWRGVRDTTPGGILASALLPLIAWYVYGGPAGIVVAVFAALTLPKHVRQWRELLAATRPDAG